MEISGNSDEDDECDNDNDTDGDNDDDIGDNGFYFSQCFKDSFMTVCFVT